MILHFYTSLAPAEEFFIGHARVFEENDALCYLKPDYQQRPLVEKIVMAIYSKVNGVSELRKMQYLDVHQWMPRIAIESLTKKYSLEYYPRVAFLGTEGSILAGVCQEELGNKGYVYVIPEKPL